MAYSVKLTPRAAREFAGLEAQTQRRVATALTGLAADPFAAAGVKALTGGGYRLRVGDYRVLFSIDGSELVVLVVKVGHRREVYR